MYAKKFMEEAIRAAKESVLCGGGPFGAVVVKEDRVVAVCTNSVTMDNDPTAHAEVNVIRRACRVLGSFNLSGCELYTSCEPCPMCLGAIYWAHPDAVYYASDKNDAARAGFDDSFIYEELRLPYSERSIPFVNKPEAGIGDEFRLWNAKKDKTEY